MCLDTVDKETMIVKEAYKIFSVRGGMLEGRLRKQLFNKCRWITDDNTCNIKTDDREQETYYPAGFHCYVDLEWAKVDCTSSEVVHRVLVKEIVASGKQISSLERSQTIVARKIFIMEEVSQCPIPA